MPKVKQYKPKAPQVDWGWALVLERKARLDMSLQDIAVGADLSYEYVRKVFASGSPVVWPPDTRDKILAVLGLKARIVIEPVEE